MGIRWSLLALVLATSCLPQDWGDGGESSTPSFVQGDAPAAVVTARAAAESAPASILHDDEDAALDPRPERRSPRDRSLIVAEAKELQRLIEATPNRAADKPALLRRLAEDYVEIGDGATDARIAMVAHQAAIGTYTALVQTPFEPPYPQLDEARFYLALEEARAGNADTARRAALDVLASVHHGVLASRARFVLAAALAAGGSDPKDAGETFERESRSSDRALAKLAMRRLGRSAPATAPAPSAPPPPAPSAAPPCTLDMECDGANVCRNGACVRL